MSKMDAKTLAKIVVERMKNAANVNTYGELGVIFGGISSQAISGAIGKGKVPEGWFEIMLEGYGVTKEILFKNLENEQEFPCKGVGFEAPRAFPAGSGNNDDEEIPEEELITMTRNVLRSNTVYRSALASNIRAFNQAVEDEKEMDDMRKSMERMECGMDEMRDMMRQLLANQSPEKKRVGNDH